MENVTLSQDMSYFSFQIKLLKIFAYFLPINSLPKWFNVRWVSFSIMVFPIGVLPDIQRNNWNRVDFCNTHHKCVILVICLWYNKLSWPIFKYTKPDPSWHKSWLHTLFKWLLKSLKICEVFIYWLFKFTLWFMDCCGTIKNWKEKQSIE